MKPKNKKITVEELKKIVKEQASKIKLLQQKLEHKNKELQTLSDLSLTVISNKYLEEILNLVVTVTAEMMNTKICSIMLLDETKQELVITATQSLSEEYKTKPPIKVGQSVSGFAVQEKRPIKVDDVTKEPLYAYPELAKKIGIVSMLAVPMFFKDKIIGVINIYTSSEHKFTDEEIRILQTIANQAAIAIESSRLMDEVQKTKELLETRKLIERAKGILMKHKNLPESDAFRFLQKKSMDSGKPMKEVAQAIILAFETE